jgi:hypothetical protein
VFEESGYTLSQRAMVELWEEHTVHEFGDHSTEKTLTSDLLLRRAEEG